MNDRNIALAIGAVFVILLGILIAFRADISPQRDLFCDAIYRDADPAACRGERFGDPSPFSIWLPSDWFVWDSLRSGHLPLWERLQGGGYSPVLTVYNGVFHPVRWLSALFSRDVAPNAIIVIALFAGFLGTFFCAREIGTSRGASLLAAFAYAIGGAIISYAEFSGCLLPAVHLPWMILFLRRAERTRASVDVAALAIATALMYISGHPSFVFCAEVALIALAIADAVTKTSIAPLFIAGCGGAIAALLAAFALLPPVMGRGELWSYKTKTHFGSSYGIYQVPEWWRTIWSALVQRPYSQLDTSSWIYIGIPAVVLALAGIYASFRATRHLGIFAVLLGFLTLAYPGVWMAEIADMPPVKFLKSWYVAGEVWIFLALAIALGFDQLMRGGRLARGFAAGFALWIVIIYGWRAYRALDPVEWRPLPETAAIKFLRSQPPYSRVTGLWGQTHVPNDSRVTGIEDARNSQPVLLQRYVTWWSLVDKDVRRKSFPTTRMTDVLTSPLVSKFGIAYVLESRLATSQTFHMDPDPAKRDKTLSKELAGFPVVMQMPSLLVHRNPAHVHPRAEFVANYVVVPDAEAAEAALRAQPDANVVEARAPMNGGGSGVVNVAYPSDSRVTLNVQSDSGGLVVLHDTFAGGWRATIDGRAAQIVPVNVLSRGVFVTAGAHRIEMRYVPHGLVEGAVVAAITLIALIAIVSWRRGA